MRIQANKRVATGIVNHKKLTFCGLKFGIVDEL